MCERGTVLTDEELERMVEGAREARWSTIPNTFAEGPYERFLLSEARAVEMGTYTEFQRT